MGSSVSIVTRLRAPVGARIFLRHCYVQTGSGAHSALYAVGTSGGDMKLTTHLHLVTTLRVCGPIPPHPQYAFIAWCLIKQRETC
jgi:hypothetical protein